MSTTEPTSTSTSTAAADTETPAVVDDGADTVSQPKNREHLGGRLREAWHKTVGTWATDEKTTASLVKRLVEFRTLSVEESKRVLTDARKRVDENRAELDRRVDESLHKATSFFTTEQGEVRRLEERIARLEARLHVLQQEA